MSNHPEQEKLTLSPAATPSNVDSSPALKPLLAAREEKSDHEKQLTTLSRVINELRTTEDSFIRGLKQLLDAFKKENLPGFTTEESAEIAYYQESLKKIVEFRQKAPALPILLVPKDGTAANLKIINELLVNAAESPIAAESVPVDASSINYFLQMYHAKAAAREETKPALPKIQVLDSKEAAKEIIDQATKFMTAAPMHAYTRGVLEQTEFSDFLGKVFLRRPQASKKVEAILIAQNTNYASLAISVVQRLPRYVLLWNEINKYVQSTYPTQEGAAEQQTRMATLISSIDKINIMKAFQDADATTKLNNYPSKLIFKLIKMSLVERLKNTLAKQQYVLSVAYAGKVLDSNDPNVRMNKAFGTVTGILDSPDKCQNATQIFKELDLLLNHDDPLVWDIAGQTISHFHSCLSKAKMLGAKGDELNIKGEKKEEKNRVAEHFKGLQQQTDTLIRNIETLLVELPLSGEHEHALEACLLYLEGKIGLATLSERVTLKKSNYLAEMANAIFETFMIAADKECISDSGEVEYISNPVPVAEQKQKPASPPPKAKLTLITEVELSQPIITFITAMTAELSEAETIEEIRRSYGGKADKLVAANLMGLKLTRPKDELIFYTICQQIFIGSFQTDPQLRGWLIKGLEKHFPGFRVQVNYSVQVKVIAAKPAPPAPSTAVIASEELPGARLSAPKSYSKETLLTAQPIGQPAAVSNITSSSSSPLGTTTQLAEPKPASFAAKTGPRPPSEPKPASITNVGPRPPTGPKPMYLLSNGSPTSSPLATSKLPSLSGPSIASPEQLASTPAAQPQKNDSKLPTALTTEDAQQPKVEVPNNVPQHRHRLSVADRAAFFSQQPTPNPLPTPNSRPASGSVVSRSKYVAGPGFNLNNAANPKVQQNLAAQAVIVHLKKPDPSKSGAAKSLSNS